MADPFSPSCDFNHYPRRLEWSARSCLVIILNLEVKKKWNVICLSSSLVIPSQSHEIKGHEDTMMGSHPGGRVTACSVRCSIFEYLMAMMMGDLTLGQEGTSLASVWVPYDISPCPDELTIGYFFFGLKSLE
ncbi:hypothetical protein IGI04_019154 [Brassica rapa subsp. trilocularis]|uniref:Uncharacterized protein n=1 Tax=Brassica rapa subsp. trilocularis TaxID=1813537 RepID=A0ABQ7MFY3_BRACM|nr:hypothetical protein IGI04_019154 [Brassica rapa subsp. trilocularis]